jgi:hypothetical protein
MVATDVSFSGKYNDGMDVSAGVSGTTYDYVKSDGTTATGVAYDADPVLTDFTYKDVDGSSKSLQDGTPDISEYVGTTTASGDIVSTQTIAADETAVRDNYTYVSGAGETVMLGESAQDMVATHTLSDYAGATEITIKNGIADTTVDGALYSFELDNGNKFTLSADGTQLLNENGGVEIPGVGTDMETKFNEAQAAYNADKVVVEAAVADTEAKWATEQANFAAANTVFENDSAKIAELDGCFATVGEATAKLAEAQAAQQVAADKYAENGALYQAAKDVYDAPILETITNGANDAIDTAVSENKAAIEAEVSRATAVEAELDGEIAQNTSAIEEEVANRIAGDEMTLASAKAYADAKNSLSLKSAYDYTDKKVDALEEELSAGIASAAAMSSVAVSGVGNGEVSVGGGYGYYNSQSAVALGAAMGLTDNWSVNAAAGLSDSNVTFRAGTNYKFKLF